MGIFVSVAASRAITATVPHVAVQEDSGLGESPSPELSTLGRALAKGRSAYAGRDVGIIVYSDDPMVEPG